MTGSAAVDAFDGIADAYDLLVNEEDYSEWVGLFEAYAREGGAAKGRLLDVGCGTGSTFMPFLNLGYEVTAIDLSPAMVDVAARKAGDRADVFVAAAQSIPDYGVFELVTCLNGVVMTFPEGDVVDAFRSMGARLSDSGRLMFDVLTPDFAKAVDGGLRFVADAKGSFVVVRQEPDGPDRIIANIDVFTEQDTGHWARRSTTFAQRTYSREEIEAKLDQAGFEVVEQAGIKPGGGKALQRGEAERDCASLLYLARLKR